MSLKCALGAGTPLRGISSGRRTRALAWALIFKLLGIASGAVYLGDWQGFSSLCTLTFEGPGRAYAQCDPPSQNTQKFLFSGSIPRICQFTKVTAGYLCDFKSICRSRAVDRGFDLGINTYRNSTLTVSWNDPYIYPSEAPEEVGFAYVSDMECRTLQQVTQPDLTPPGWMRCNAQLRMCVVLSTASAWSNDGKIAYYGEGMVTPYPLGMTVCRDTRGPGPLAGRTCYIATNGVPMTKYRAAPFLSRLLQQDAVTLLGTGFHYGNLTYSTPEEAEEAARTAYMDQVVYQFQQATLSSLLEIINEHRGPLWFRSMYENKTREDGFDPSEVKKNADEGRTLGIICISANVVLLIMIVVMNVFFGRKVTEGDSFKRGKDPESKAGGMM